HLEGLCTSLMDAQAAGKAVIATKAGGIPEIVDDGKTGILVEPKDGEALSLALIELLEDKKKREHMARNAHDFATRNFSNDKMVEGTLEVYAELEAGKSK
ncbi:MAG: glycosyltransferase family 4 protein, partial [Planctomycetes bacterium]|nr:glycosyltransferase family 4 protein [Planctomycetota bacterium]